MKNKMIINSFNKVSCDNKDIIFERLFIKKRFNYKYVVGFVTCLVFIIAISYKPNNDMSPLTTKQDNSYEVNGCVQEDLECINEREN